MKNQPVLLTPRLRLRPPRPEDAEPLVPLCNNINVSRWLERMPHPYTSEFSHQVIGQMLADEETFIVFAEDRQTGALMGGGNLKRTDTPGRLNTGYWLGEPFWGKGFAAEMLDGLLAHGFGALSAHTVEAHVMTENLSSARLLESRGFQMTGDSLCRSVVAGDIPACLYELTREAWLEGRSLSGCARPDDLAERKTLLVSAVVLTDPDGRVLMAQRPEGKSMAGLWEFPGGKVEPGETPEMALIRELKEELGIDTLQSCLAPLTFASHAYDDFHLLMPVFVCRSWQGEPQGREGQALKWVAVNKLKDLPMPPADVPLVALIRDMLG